MALTVERENFSHRALGIDPGLAATGFALVGTLKKRGHLCTWGAIKTSAAMHTPQRLQKIYHEVCGLIEAWQPDVMALEDVFVRLTGRNLRDE